MKIIALEEHYSTPAINQEWAQLDPKYQDVSNKMFGGGDTEKRLLDFSDSRLKAMDANGIAMQVLSLTAPGTQNMEAARAVELARETNDVAARAVRENPDRFQAFATLPTPDPAQATRELERCIGELGMKGAMLGGRTREVNMDDARYFPIYQAAAKLGAPLYVHPQCPVAGVREAYYSGFGEQIDALFATAGIGWHYETGIQILRMVLSGLFDRLPDLQIVTGHWGEVVLFYLERIDSLSRAAENLERPVADYFRSHVSVTGSGIYSERYLSWAIEVLGVERVLYSTDYPYQLSDTDKPSRFLEDADLSDADKLKIASGNWERLTARVG